MSGGSRVSSFRVIAPLVFAGLAYATAQTTIVPVVPQIQAATASSAGQVAWVVTGFFVSSAALTVLAGRMGDLFGRKRVLLAVLAVFGVGAVVAALGTSLAAVVAGRVIMGTAGGVFPLAYAILGQHLPRERAAFGMGLISSMFGLGGALGLPVGGFVAEHFGYQGLFWATAVMTVLALAAIAALVPDDRGYGKGRIDWLGAILLGVALGGPLTAISKAEDWGWASPWTLGLLGVGVLVSGVLVVVELRISEPLINPGLMRRRNVWVANLTACLVTVGQAVSFFLIPQVVQLPEESGVGLGVGVGQAGLFLLPSALVVMVAGPLTGRAVARFGVRPPLAVGALGTGAGLGVLAVGGADTASILVGGAVLGLAGGVAFAALPMLIADSVPTEHLGAANGVNTIVRHVSMAVAAQLAAAVLVLGTPRGSGYPSEGAFALDYGSGAVLGLLALLLVPLVRPRPRAEAAPPPEEAAPAEHTGLTAPRIG
ncbi:MFS transporter [Actinorugispora endophytica]|uniref:MFS transporter n=1 Tax=Actinorugispora endophytica TaxID=1605990 RepID=A0A4R6UB80_9ACTN|nr:MFS transporter [Actinorugispora endophytica]